VPSAVGNSREKPIRGKTDGVVSGHGGGLPSRGIGPVRQPDIAGTTLMPDL
jgi:hypothetical protein